MDPDPLGDKQVILHTCCAPCSAAIIEYLLLNDYRPTLFFYNPNIFPLEEYEKRKEELKSYATSLDIPFMDGDYDHESWLNAIKGLENEPERGLRCLECFKYRLLASASLASKLKINLFTTTLASSRWKSLEQINEAGKWATEQINDVSFWNRNWRKEGLSQRRNELLKENNFYNQTFCGCEFSQ